MSNTGAMLIPEGNDILSPSSRRSGELDVFTQCSEQYCYINGHTIHDTPGRDTSVIERIMKERTPCQLCSAFSECRRECKAFISYCQHGSWKATDVSEFYKTGKKASNPICVMHK